MKIITIVCGLGRCGGDLYSASILLRRSLAVLAVCVLLPACAATPSSNAKPDEEYVKAAWAYFKHKCDTEAGEKIYKTFTGVKSVLVVKPLPPATEKDLYDQFWMGDPYSNATPWSRRGEQQAVTLIGNRKFKSGSGEIGFDFFEQEISGESNNRFERVSLGNNPPYFVSKIEITKPVSGYGVIWEDISTPEDRRYWVAASRFRVIDLKSNMIVAERIGYLIESGFGSIAGQRRPWLTARGFGPNGRSCPSIHDWGDRFFILKVLNPTQESQDGK